MKTLRCSYLYADGHAVLLHQKRYKDAGEVEFAEIHEKWTEAHLGFKGRIVFNSPELLRMAKRAVRIEAQEPRLDHGSQNTKEKGIAVGHLVFTFGEYSDYLCLTTMPNLISASWTYQPDVVATCPHPDIARWGSLSVGKFVPAKRAQSTLIAA